MMRMRKRGEWVRNQGERDRERLRKRKKEKEGKRERAGEKKNENYKKRHSIDQQIGHWSFDSFID